MRQPLEVTTTTSSLTGSIPSPSPFTFAKSGANGRTSSTSTDNIFSYACTPQYPLNHCVKPTAGLLDDLNLLFGLDESYIKDDILANLVVELGLDNMETLPELRVRHHSLGDKDVWIVRQES